MNERLRRAWLRHPLVAFVRHRQLVTFYAQLHALIRAGIALPTAFEQLTRYAPDAMMAKGLAQVARAVREGASLGDALRTNSALFDDANVELVAFAEEAGKLEPVIAAITTHLEAVQRQRWRALLGALWPMYLGAALVFVGPLLDVAKTVKSTSGIGAAYLGGLSSSLGLAVGLVALVFSVPLLIAALDVETQWDRFLRSVPVVSSPLRQLAASRFVLGLGLASASGMETVRALRLATKATASPAILSRLPQVEARLRSGATLTEAVSTLNLLTPGELGTLSVAETTGTLDHTLEKLSRELQESSLRALRFLVLLVTALVAGVVLVKLIVGMVATLLGPVKTLYDAAGSGNLDG